MTNATLCGSECIFDWNSCDASFRPRTSQCGSQPWERWRPAGRFAKETDWEDAGRMPALVRLRGHGDGTVRVRSLAAKSREELKRNCVAVRRGGKQRNENDQSVTQDGPGVVCRELDSVGVDGRAFELMAKPVKRAIGGKPNRRTAGRSPVIALMVGDGMVGSPCEVIRETRREQDGVHAACEEPKSRPAGVRASVVAMKRVMTVERRERRKVDG